MPSAGMPRDSPQCRKSAGNVYVQTFLVTDSGVPGGKGTAALLWNAWNAHASGVAHQEFPDGTLQLEYADEVTEKRCEDRDKVHRGDLQTNRVR